MTDDNFEEYLDKNFDYKRLTKQALRKIMYDNGVEDIPLLRVKKAVILEAYKKHIYDRIDKIKEEKGLLKKRLENEYQKDRSSILDLDINKTKSPGRNIGNKTHMYSKDLRTPKKKMNAPIENHLDDENETPFMLRRQSVSALNDNDSSDERSDEESEEEEVKLIKPVEKETKKSKDISKKSEKPPKKHKDTKKKDRNDEMSNIIFSSEEETSVKNKTKPKKKRFSLKIKSNKGYEEAETTICSRMGSIVPRMSILVVIFTFLTGIYIYLKFFCPYCKKSDDLFCIPVPKHTRLSNGKLQCDKGYVLYKNPLKNFCVVDDTKERQIERTVKSIVRKLELKNGDFLYGMANSSMIPLSDLTDDAEVIQKLHSVPGINVHDNYVYSVNYQTSLKTFLSFYFKKTLFFLLPFVVVAFSFKYYLTRRRKSIEIKKEAKIIMKDISNVLMRQVLISTKNKNIPPYVYLDQLKDVYGDNESVWKEVVKIVGSNSNIKSTTSSNDQNIVEWVGPIINLSEVNSPVL